MDVEEKVLERIKPDAEEERSIREAAEELVSMAERLISENGMDATPIIVGSVAKGTFLKDPDLDIFIMFPMDMPREEMEKNGLELGRKLIPDGRENYAEHPYIHGTFRGYEVDIVPCYRITDSSRKMSAVDRTPFHTRFVAEHMSDDQKDEARLLKAFMKGVGVYGAEAEIEGFSGYLVELLIIRYGSFRQVLEASRSWKRGTRLHLGNDAGNRFDTPLVFIDPVDPKRNVASALSPETYALFIHAASEYLREPGTQFFFPCERRPEDAGRITDEVRRRGTHIMGVSMYRPDLVGDVLFPQVKKGRRILSQRLNDMGFNVINSHYMVGKSEILYIFEMEVSRLPRIKRHFGPPVWNENSRKFLDKWKGSPLVIDSGRWVAYIERDATTPEEYLERSMHEHNLGKDLSEVAKKSFSILSLEEIAEKYPLAITEMLFPLFPWERPCPPSP